MSLGSLHSMRLAAHVRRLVEKTKAKVLVVTHEGHSWERLVFYSAKQVNPSIKCIGYMNAPLFQRQHAVKRKLAEDYNPDIIFTSGHVQKSQMEGTESLKNIPINVLGTKRMYDEKTVFHHAGQKISDNGRGKKTYLIIPEGIESEIQLLFQFSLKCAHQYRHANFVWRLHPLYSFKKIFSKDMFSFDALIAKNKIFKSVPNNVEFSNRDLDQDLDRCHSVLYRGSSAVIKAVVAGLRPIYLHVPSQMRIDPLYEFNDWKMEIETTQDFAETLFSPEIEDTHYQKAREYCLKIYMPFDYSAIISYLSLLER